MQNNSGGVNSPVRAFKSVNSLPVFIEKGKGAYIYDLDGNKYIDYIGSWGPMILGHANKNVINSIQKVIKNSTSFGAPTILETKLAKIIKKISLHGKNENDKFGHRGNNELHTAS